MLTLWCILVSLVSLYFFGLPIASLLSKGENDQESKWVLAPFLGLSSVTLVLQNLVYLDLPIRITAPWLWAGSALLWIWVIRSGRFPSLFSSFPSTLFLSAIAVYLIQGMGMLIVGADYYVGRAWHDQLNSTATAQFLNDYPFHLSLQDVQNQPYLFQAIAPYGNGIVKTMDRIGSNILQAFFATSTFSSAKTAFEPTSLLSPFLITLAAYGLARKFLLSKGKALLTAVGAGMLPGITMVHLESFLSQALAIPMLLSWPFFLSNALHQPSWKNLFMASILLAGATAIYTEFYVLFLGLAILVFGFHTFFAQEKRLSRLLFLTVLVCVALFLNIGFAPGILMIFKRVAVENILSGIYPWARSLEGLQRLWLGDLGTKIIPGPAWLFGLISLFLVFIAFMGLGSAFMKKKNEFSLAVLAMALLPFSLLLWGPRYGYQFYKILLSVSPLLPLGIVVAANGAGSSRLAKLSLRLAGKTALIIILPLSLLGTADMTIRSGVGKTQEEIGRGGAHKMLDPATKKVQDVLSGMRGQYVIISWKDDFFNGAYVNGWLAYFARKNRVWVTNPLITDLNLLDLPGIKITLDNPPPEFFLLIPSQNSNSLAGSSIQMAWSEGPYALYKISGRNWVALADIRNPNGLERADGEEFFWVGNNETVIEAIAGRAGTMVWGIKLYPGPSLPHQDFRNILISTSMGYREEKCIKNWGASTISVPVTAGQTRIIISALDPPAPQSQPAADPRIMLLQLRGLKILELR